MALELGTLEELAGKAYFVVGIGTEGGVKSSFHLSVAGVNTGAWGDI